jgi:GH24 family phage-related lysozyme (muramidase)
MTGFHEVSRDGVLFVAGREALVLVRYQDGRDADGTPRWAIGFGHNSKALRPGDKITEAQAFDVLIRDLEYWADQIRKRLRVQLEQHEFDAILSIAFNAGNRYMPALVHLVNYGAPPEMIVKIIPLMAYALDGTWSNGVHTRREAEALMYETGDYGPLGTVPFYAGNPRTTKRQEYTVKPDDIRLG